MTYYSKRYKKKSYDLGCKPTTILRRQLERTLIKDVKRMNDEIVKLEIKRQEYFEYKKRRILYEQQVLLTIDPLKQNKNELINEKSNYKTGIKYLFRHRVLKDDIHLEVNRIDCQIRKKYDDLKNKLNVQKSQYCGYELNANDMDRHIGYVNKKIERYQEAIKTYQYEIELKQSKNRKLENIKGLAAQTVNKTRQRANQIKSNMIENDFCPYCGEWIKDAHVDHIYPVAKGGLSTTENMVRVCSDCNMKKKDLTLNQFIIKYNLDRDSIVGNLDMLNKTY